MTDLNLNAGDVDNRIDGHLYFRIKGERNWHLEKRNLGDSKETFCNKRVDANDIEEQSVYDQVDDCPKCRKALVDPSPIS